jgi:hypothetical protein
MMYAVTASVTRKVGKWSSTTHSPTFFLDSNVQGIVSVNHAERIALRMVQDMAGPDAEVYVSVVEA